MVWVKMAGSKWPKRIVAALICAAGISMALYGLFYGLSEQGRYAQIANQAASEYSRNAAYKEQQACAAVAIAKLAECRRDAKAEHAQRRYDNQREYDDLVAQQRSALWTSITGIAAITGMMLSAIGVALVYSTFRETRRSADAAMKNYEAFVKFETAMIDVDFTDPPNFPLINEVRHIHFKLSIRNIGRAPALIDAICVKGEGPLPYRKLLSGGDRFRILDEFVVAIPAESLVEGYIQYETAVAPGVKRLFHISIGDAGAENRATIHPDIIIYEGEDDYENPFV